MTSKIHRWTVTLSKKPFYTKMSISSKGYIRKRWNPFNRLSFYSVRNRGNNYVLNGLVEKLHDYWWQVWWKPYTKLPQIVLLVINDENILDCVFRYVFLIGLFCRHYFFCAYDQSLENSGEGSWFVIIFGSYHLRGCSIVRMNYKWLHFPYYLLISLSMAAMRLMMVI